MEQKTGIGPLYDEFSQGYGADIRLIGPDFHTNSTYKQGSTLCGEQPAKERPDYPTRNAPARETSMQPTTCPACHRHGLAHVPLVAHSPVVLQLGYWKVVAVHAAACLTCGAVTPYLDDAGLNKLREWSGQATKE